MIRCPCYRVTCGSMGKPVTLRAVRKHLQVYKDTGIKCPCKQCNGSFIQPPAICIEHLLHYGGTQEVPSEPEVVDADAHGERDSAPDSDADGRRLIADVHLHELKEGVKYV